MKYYANAKGNDKIMKFAETLQELKKVMLNDINQRNDNIV